MITLRDFLDLSMDTYYKINIYYCNGGNEIIHQLEVSEIEDYLETNNMEDLLDNEILSWDIQEIYEGATLKDREFTLNI